MCIAQLGLQTVCVRKGNVPAQPVGRPTNAREQVGSMTEFSRNATETMKTTTVSVPWQKFTMKPYGHPCEQRSLKLCGPTGKLALQTGIDVNRGPVKLIKDAGFWCSSSSLVLSSVVTYRICGTVYLLKILIRSLPTCKVH